MELRALGAITPAELADSLRAEMKLIRDRLDPDLVDLRRRMPFHGGVVIDTAAGLSNLLAEFLVHGWDVASAAGRRWPIEERDAALILNGVMQLVPAYARGDATDSLRVVLRVPDAARWLLDFDGGRCESRPARAGEKADVVVRAPARTLMLALYSRLSLTASMRGGLLVAGGRRPWLVTRLPRLVHKP